MIKKDAIMEIKIGTPFMSRLNEIILYFSKDKTEEDLEKYKREATENKGFSEEWMTHVTTLGILIRELQNEAEKNSQTYETSMDALNDEMKKIISSDFTTEEEN